ncbi:MAG: hypothetical protein GY756_27580 [bacterium]|nr:hypothetical protein [bacterium]
MKKFIIISLIILFVIIIFIGTAAILIISNSVPYSSFEITNKSISAMNSLNKKYQEESYYIYSPNVGYKLRKLTLSQSELNAMFRMVVAGNQVSSALQNTEKSIEISEAKFEEGIFSIDFYYELPVKTPLGSYIVFSSKIVPILKNNLIKIKFVSFNVGDISLPVSVVNYFINKTDRNINNNRLLKLLKKSIKELTVKKDEIIIYYYPKEVKTFLNQL